MNLSNKLFYYTTLAPTVSGLRVVTHVSIKFIHKRPTLLVGRYGQDASILIDDHPRLLRGCLDAPLKDEILKWVKINKDALFKYWNEEYDTSQLILSLTPLQMIKNV